MSSQNIKIPKVNKIKKKYPLLDAIALISWGALLLKYSLTGQLKLLIHPNYFLLVAFSSIILIILGIVLILFRFIARKQSLSTSEHISLFPPGLSSSLLLAIAILGFIVPPKILTSQTALQRRVSDIPLTKTQPQAFRTATQPEERSLIDWVRTLNAYPEPDAYAGQPAKISGFVLHPDELPPNYLLLSRFVITCCAVDAYPIGIPVKIDSDRAYYPPDTWLEITGTMITETLPIKNNSTSQTITSKRQLVLAAKSVESIPTPKDPYSYQ